MPSVSPATLYNVIQEYSRSSHRQMAILEFQCIAAGGPVFQLLMIRIADGRRLVGQSLISLLKVRVGQDYAHKL